MLKDDLELVQAVRDWRPPTELHPIAMVAWHLYEGNGNTFPQKAVDELRAILDGYGDDLIGLGAAIEGLARFILLMTQVHHDEDTAGKVAKLVDAYTDRFEPFWRAVGEAVANIQADAKGSFENFADRDRAAEKVAPKHGQAAPQGTVPLRNLAPPPRPPRFKKKAAGAR